ncbi:MAG TPA: hypothetical protein VFY16_11280 [Gemmatimonadaceae bacterium]|nr:hypothetical protein [Gemmatimonadaceae bacterium]
MPRLPEGLVDNELAVNADASARVVGALLAMARSFWPPRRRSVRVPSSHVTGCRTDATRSCV